MGVGTDFQAFKDSYNIGTTLMSSISYRYQRITGQLNKDFWTTDSAHAHSLYVGSYGRDTAAKGVSDLDVAFQLPYAVYDRYHNHSGNGQSALLQAVRTSLQNTYPTTAIGGDGQVVVIGFTDGITFEILPVFESTTGAYIHPDSNNGGSWKPTNPRAEIDAVRDRNHACNGNLKALGRMMRVWRDFNKVDISGALIDALAYQFIAAWAYRDKSFAYHDYLARDFLKYLAGLDPSQSSWRMPGSGKLIEKKGNFQRAASVDADLADGACALQGEDEGAARRKKWRVIFGPAFPE
jgi:hypothetical protein